VVDDGSDTTSTSTTVSDGDRRKLTAIGLVGFLLVLVGLVLLLSGAFHLVDERTVSAEGVWWVGLGLIGLSIGICLLQASVRTPKSPPDPTPWLRLVISSVCIAAVLGIAIFSVADAYLPRPINGTPCEGAEPKRSPRLRTGQQAVAFSFPEENAGTTGLQISMGRGRPKQETASQVLVRTTGTRTSSRRAAARSVGNEGSSTSKAQSARERRTPVTRLGSDYRVQVVLTELQRDDGAHMVEGSFAASAIMVNPNNMRLELCVAPQAVEEVDPGTYTGVLTVVDPRVARFDVPVRVDLQFNRWPVLVTLLVGTLVVAAFVLFNGTRQLAGETASLEPKTLKEFGLWAVTNPVALGTGVVAAVAIFANQYLADAAWSGRSAEVFALIGAIAAAFLGAATVAAGVDPRRKRKDGDTPGPVKAPVSTEPRPPKTGSKAAAKAAKRKRQRERRRREEQHGAAVPVPAATPVVLPAIDVDDDDDDHLGHLDDHEMAAQGDEDDVDDPTAADIPGDDEVEAQGSPTLAAADETGEAPPAPEYDIPDDGAVAPVEATEDRRAAGIPDDDEVDPGPATAGGGAIPPDDPPEGG
jgi:hypothetical protein